MKRGSKKHKGLAKDIEMRDRLSELPDEVLVHILSFMPTLDSVRTVLLRRFGDLWNLVPILKFDSDSFSEHFYEDENKRFLIFVRNVLMLHQASTIDSFKLVIRIEYDNYYWTKHKSNEVHMWIQSALNKKARVMDLYISDYEEFHLPHFLFTNEYVVKLALGCCKLERQRQVHMKSLTSFSISSMDLDEKILSEIIAGFPSLQELYISNCYIEDLTLTAKSVKELRLDMKEIHRINCPYIEILGLYGYAGNFTATDLSSVREGSIRFHACDELEDYAGQIIEFLKKLENAKLLTFNGLTFKNFTFPINQWKRVILTDSYLHTTHLLCVYSLVRNSPCLEQLTIDAEYGSEYVEMKSDQISQELSSPCVSPHLRQVHIRSRKDHDHHVQLQLSEFLLKSAVALDELVISSKGNKLTLRKELKLVKKFLCFPRASSNARIIFH